MRNVCLCLHVCVCGGVLWCPQSVTGFGRMMIERSREIVEERFSTRNGAKHDAKVRHIPM